MEAPSLGPVTPGRPALAAFAPVETWIRERVQAARAEGERLVAEARREAERIRREGEGRLRDLVREGQDAAVREAEDRARDRVSRARVAVNRWVERAEAALPSVVEDALDLLTADRPAGAEAASGAPAAPPAAPPDGAAPSSSA